jgi:hypothetical protein
VKKPFLKQLLVIAGLGLVTFIVWEMFKAYRAGKTAITDLLFAPWNALKAAWTATSAVASTVASGVSAAASLPSITQTELQNAQAQGSTAASYQPGGTMYNTILATQGQAAADAAAASSAANAAAELAQAQSDSSWWGFGNLYQYL